MAFIPAPLTAEASMHYRGPNGNEFVNVYYFRRQSGQWDQLQLTQLGLSMLAWEGTAAKNGRSNQITCISCVCRNIAEEDSWVVTTQPGVPIVGTVNTPALPANVTWCLKFLTGRAGRSYRGRTYWVGLGEGQVAGDFITQGVATAINGYFGAPWQEVQEDNECDHVVVSRYHNKAPRVIAEVTSVTLVTYTDLRVDTQRRRLVGEGN